YFNDAGNQPTEGISQRHSATRWVFDRINEDWGGSSSIGRVGGSAEFMKWKTFTAMAGVDGIPRNIVRIPERSQDNFVWIGPAYGK
ncbi:MAG: hypothetical protein ACKOET_19100, partial [Verrucomicrobiota bacterium]